VVIPLLLTLLGGCASKAPEPEAGTAAVETARPVEDARAVIVCLGDSLTAGHGVVGSGWPELLQQDLDGKGYPYRVVNAGVSGDTSAGGLTRIGPLLKMKPRILILELGGNDGLRGTPVATTRANLEEMIVAGKEAGAKVLLAGMTLPPNYGPGYIREFERMYTDLAGKHDLPLIPFRLESLGGNTEGLMQRDGLHPTEEGYRRLLPHIVKQVEPLLGK